MFWLLDKDSDSSWSYTTHAVLLVSLLCVVYVDACRIVAIRFWAYRTALINVLIGGIVRVKVIFTTVEVYLRFYCQIFHNLMFQSPLSKVLFFNFFRL